MWLPIALLGACLWSLVSLYDRFSVKAVFTRPTQGLFIATIFSSVGLLAAPWVEWQKMTWSICVLGLLGGLLLQLSQVFYFFALDQEEVGDVTALGSSYPLLVAIVAIPMGKYLTTTQWLGVLLVIVPLVLIRALAPSRRQFKKGGMLLLLGYIVGLAASNLVMSVVVNKVSFATSFFPYSIGLIIGGALPFLPKKQRRLLIEAWPAIKKRIWQFGLVELINVLALGCEICALSLAHPALVTAAGSTEPAIVFILAACLACKRTHIFPEVQHLKLKVFLVLIMTVGLGLLAS